MLLAYMLTSADLETDMKISIARDLAKKRISNAKSTLLKPIVATRVGPLFQAAHSAKPTRGFLSRAHKIVKKSFCKLVQSKAKYKKLQSEKWIRLFLL
eukprot:UN03184